MELDFRTKQPLQACRTCLAKICDNNLYYLFRPELSETGNKLLELFSQLNLTLTPNPVICSKCYEIIGSIYNFKKRLMHIEKFIHLYIEKHSVSVIDLTEVDPYASKCLNFENDSSPLETYVDKIDKSAMLDKYATEFINEPQYDTQLPNGELQEPESQNEFVDINNLIVNSDSQSSNIEGSRAANVIIIDSSSDDEDDTFRFYKKTPFCCDKCSYRTAYIQNLISHQTGHAQEASLQKYVELEYEEAFQAGQIT